MPPQNRSIRLALVQMRVVPGDFVKNLAHAIELTAQAAAQRAEIVVLPEALPFGWMDPAAQKNAQEIPAGQQFATLAEAASRHGIYLCTGLVERADEKIFNSAILISPQGELLLHHRKINELEIAHDCYAPGDRLGVVDTPLGRIGLMICADAFAPGQVITRTLGLMGAQLILSPCAWAVPPDHDNNRTPYGQLWFDNYGPVARDFHLWMAGCSNVGPIRSGPWAGHSCIGCSLVVDPAGTQHLKGPYGSSAETIILTEIMVTTPPVRGPDSMTPNRVVQCKAERIAASISCG